MTQIRFCGRAPRGRLSAPARGSRAANVADDRASSALRTRSSSLLELEGPRRGRRSAPSSRRRSRSRSRSSSSLAVPSSIPSATARASSSATSATSPSSARRRPTRSSGEPTVELGVELLGRELREPWHELRVRDDSRRARLARAGRPLRAAAARSCRRRAACGCEPGLAVAGRSSRSAASRDRSWCSGESSALLENAPHAPYAFCRSAARSISIRTR